MRRLRPQLVKITIRFSDGHDFYLGQIPEGDDEAIVEQFVAEYIGFCERWELGERATR